MGSDMSEPILTDEDYKQLKNQIKEKKKIQMVSCFPCYFQAVTRAGKLRFKSFKILRGVGRLQLHIIRM